MTATVERIELLRKSMHITRQKLSELSGIPVPTLQSAVYRNKTISLETACKIANALNVPVGYLAGEEARKATANNSLANNPYWKRISAVSERQRAKGMQTYGEGLESNPAAILTRLTYLEEELVDALYYIEWIKDKVEEGESNVTTDNDAAAADN